MMILQEAAHAATQVGHAEGAHGAAFHPVLPWLILALPLLGFVINGAAALIAARRALPKLPPVGDPYWDAHGHDEHAPAPAHQPA
ncbi:MAG TPA: hypothetical protein VGB66_15985, partial [Longimicrobium sp.]